MKGIIVLSFGSTYQEGREKSFDAIEELVRNRYNDCLVDRAYSSVTVKKILKERDGIEVFGLPEVTSQFQSKGIENPMILSLYMIPGIEHAKIVRSGFQHTLTLLEEEKYYSEILSSLHLSQDKNVVNLLVGHGTRVKADEYYGKFLEYVRNEGYDNLYISTMEGKDDLDSVLPLLKSYKKIRLIPFMLVSGDHVHNDIIGEEDSYRKLLSDEGFEVEYESIGLGEREEIQQIFLKKLGELME